MTTQAAITTVTELKTELSNWLNRTDQTARYDAFIALAESRIRRVLRTKHPVTQTIATVVDTGSYSIASLDESPEIKEIYVTAPVASAGTIDLVTAGQLYNNRRENLSSNGKPLLGSLQGSTLLISPLPDAVYTIEIETELLLEPLLAGTNEDNVVLLNYPDVYLYGALVHAAPYIEDDERVGLWKGFLDEALAELEQAQIRNEYPQRLNMGVPMNLAPISTHIQRR